MEIEDIIHDGDKLMVTFVDDDVQPILKVIMPVSEAWKISKYLRDNLSYGSSLKKSKR